MENQVIRGTQKPGLGAIFLMIRSLRSLEVSCCESHVVPGYDDRARSCLDVCAHDSNNSVLLHIPPSEITAAQVHHGRRPSYINFPNDAASKK
ncbi:hypothetical protein WAI453_013422 [Rhynchosporium graminicola]